MTATFSNPYRDLTKPFCLRYVTRQSSGRKFSSQGAVMSCTRKGGALRLVEPVSAPPIFNIERWWSLEAVEFLRLLRAAIEHVTQPDTEARNLLLVAFCRTLIEQSNAGFNHQSMSFKGNEQPALLSSSDRRAVFKTHVEFVLSGAAENPAGSASVVLADSREIRGYCTCRQQEWRLAFQVCSKVF